MNEWYGIPETKRKTDRKVIRFYAWWLIVWGILLALFMCFSVYQVFQFEHDRRKYRSFKFISMVIWVIFLGLCSVLMVISGLFLIGGVKKDGRKNLHRGKIISFIYPIAYWYLIYPIIIHILCIIYLNRYVKKTWEDDVNNIQS
ncbi:uncharacterized protein [Drosophila takahashii]|uniref:uncharacterized protein isoform X1 n=1 Tax=Drosophila takahashii TaxID=29030 RepID=UPI00389935FA